MKKNLGRLAKRYALALVSATKENGSLSLQKAAEEITRFAALFESSRELSVNLPSPVYLLEDKVKAISQVAKSNGMSEIVVKFLETVARRERLFALPEIARIFSEVADSEAGIVAVEVTTAKVVIEAERKEAEQSLRGKIKGTLSFNWNVNPEIIGGMVIRYSGQVFDGSLKGRLENMAKELTGAGA